MSDLRTAAQQVLEAWQTATYGHPSHHKATLLSMTALSAALAQQAEPKGGGNLPPPLQAEPVVRECSDPMCACRGGPCAECEEGQREKEIEDLRISLDFYQRRCEALQAWQSRMRDPERTIVCDILANGFTLDPAFAGDRYTAPTQRKPLTEEEIDAATAQERDALLDHIYEYGTAAEGVLERIRKLARATERAHGIGEQP